MILNALTKRKRNGWQVAIKEHLQHVSPSFRDGYRAGWLDTFLDVRSPIGATSPDGNYRDGYVQGVKDYKGAWLASGE